MLWTHGYTTSDQPLRFATASGELMATHKEDGIELDFPALPTRPTTAPAGLADVVGRSHRFVGQTESKNGQERETNYLIELADEGSVRDLRPDLARLASLPAGGLIVTAPAADSAFDFVSRYFAPAAGISEDPVTGSAHCTLGPHWQQRLGKDRFRACQVSPRGGSLTVEVAGDRVLLGGTAVTTIKGELATN